MIPNLIDTTFRWMAPHDVPQVAAIIAADSPLGHSIEHISNVLNSAIGKRNVGAIVAEVEASASISGFAVWRLNRRFAELRAIAVDRRHRRTRVATRLILKIVEFVKFSSRPRLEAIVRESNLDAQLLLRSLSFRANEVLRGHFGDEGEDGYRFELFL